MSGAPRVLYITGMLRSGSTLLGNLLDTLPGVVHVGELHFLWLNGFLREGTNSTCGCGTDLGRCEFWNSTLRAAAVPVMPTAARMVDAQRRYLRIRHTPARLTRSRPRTGSTERASTPRAGSTERASTPAAELQAALDTTAALYRALAEDSGRRLIVDGSKCPAEAAALLARDDLDVRVVHLVRDPRAVMWSYRAGKLYIPPMGGARVLGYWAAFNLASELVGIRWSRRYRRVRYEDLTTAPRPVLTDLLRWLGLPDPAPVDPYGRATLGVNHTVTGNPDRLRHGPVQVRADERWRTGLPPLTRTLVAAGMAPLLARYRYRGG
jgi:hypothetical protein